MEYLFTVENIFLITYRGLVVTSGPKNRIVRIGDRIQLILPDKSVIQTKIKGLEFHENWAALLEKGLRKEDVPIGTEVWLLD
jgi:translation elongation factor EF-Tu-like GTPase